MHFQQILQSATGHVSFNVSLTWSVLQDETIKYQAALRTMDIFAKKHSVQHDIITGHPLVANYIIPPKPDSM